jgi:ABC-type histidine transport system ATPase subunit
MCIEFELLKGEPAMALKAEIEQEILALMQDFCEKTGLSIVDIDFTLAKNQFTYPSTFSLEVPTNDDFID